MNAWTDEQRLAIEAENGTLLVCAAAGSGKTSVLVERIVRKLTQDESPVSPERLLVVTFTNAAAAEMRARIYRRLGELSATSDDPAALRTVMSRMDEMTVSTMDAFCMRLVRENFSACGLESDFTVIEEGAEKALKAQIARTVTNEIYKKSRNEPTALTRMFQVGRDDDALMNAIVTLSDFSMSEPDPAAWLDTVAAHFSPCSVILKSSGDRVSRWNECMIGVHFSARISGAANGLHMPFSTTQTPLLYTSRTSMLSRSSSTRTSAR